jgi:hypothetical protein
MIDTSALQVPHMPPFVGTDDEAEALVAYLGGLVDEPEPRMAMTGGE